jgi:hypothetical protein
VSSGESVRVHCGHTHGRCSTLTRKSKPVASADASKPRDIAGRRMLAPSRMYGKIAGCHGDDTVEDSVATTGATYGGLQRNRSYLYRLPA